MLRALVLVAVLVGLGLVVFFTADVTMDGGDDRNERAMVGAILVLIVGLLATTVYATLHPRNAERRTRGR